jgi:translation elongation factor EF-G
LASGHIVIDRGIFLRIRIQEAQMQEHHIAGVFENDSVAQAVINALAVAGISRADIGLYPSSDIPINSDITTITAAEHSEAPLAQVFRSMLGMDKEDDAVARTFSQSLQRGQSVVTVRLQGEEQVDTVVNVMNDFDPIDCASPPPVAAEGAAGAGTQRGNVYVFEAVTGRKGAV